MGFCQNIVISNPLEWEMKQTILFDALQRWPFIRLPRRDLLPVHAQFAPPELTHYQFVNERDYETAIEQDGEVEDGLPAWSLKHPSVTFAFVSADCAGGTCLYGGRVVRSGTTVLKVEGTYAGHLELLARVGLNLGTVHFPPFSRGYFEYGRDHDSEGSTA